MKLDEIGFAMVTDTRAREAGINTDISRCDIVITDQCNFACPYCNGCHKECKGSIELSSFHELIHELSRHHCKCIQLTGGEPTQHSGLLQMVESARENGIGRIAVATNGSAAWSLYKKLIQAGVNEFSVSLDAAEEKLGDSLAGNIQGAWRQVINNIKAISETGTYLSVGVVANEETYERIVSLLHFIDAELRVNDIRLTSDSHYNQLMADVIAELNVCLRKYPVLSYRVANMKRGRNVRGLNENDCNRCYMQLDDIAIAGNYHFPCMIHIREGGDPIGRITDITTMRQQRESWVYRHDTHSDPICKKYCIDFKADYNNRYRKFHDLT